MTQAAEPKDNWCAEFFDELFAEHCLMTRSSAEIGQIVAFLSRILRLTPGATVFDQCCGVGTLSLALAQAGYRIQGVDLIPAYIEQASREAAEKQLDCRFAAGDAFSYVAPDRCDAALNWWTSFGYTPDDRQNAKMLECVFASLKPGGWFALDYMNAAERRRLLGPEGRTAYTQTKTDCTIYCESRLEGEMLVKDWSYTGADGRRIDKPGGGAKLYTPAQLQKLLEGCGFGNVTFFGSAKGEALGPASPRCIALAQKPEA